MKNDKLKALFGKYEIDNSEAVQRGGDNRTFETIHTNSAQTAGDVGSSDSDLSAHYDFVSGGQVGVAMSDY